MSKDKYVVIDLETSVNNVGDEAIGKMKASPFSDKNDIVLFGGRGANGNSTIVSELQETDDPGKRIIVGQNIGFDLLHLWNNPKLKAQDSRDMYYDIAIWDTMLAEYLLKGQEELFPSLDDISITYGLEVKPSKVKELWDAGVKTEDMDKDMLTGYLEHDLKVTHEIFLKQVELAEKRGMLPLMWASMEARLATIEMEHNGMHFDIDKCEEAGVELKGKIAILSMKISSVMCGVLPALPMVNLSSSTQQSLMLFGGEYTTKEPHPLLDDERNPVYFKSGPRKGEPRTKLVEVIHTTKGLQRGLKHHSTEGKKRGTYSTSDGVLKSILVSSTTETHTKEYVKALLEYRKLNKDYTTYVGTFPNLVWPDGCIHGTINHTSTRTSRLSSQQPNLQNINGK